MYIDNDTDLEDYYINFYYWVMECVDDDDLPPDNEIVLVKIYVKLVLGQKDLARVSAHVV